MPFTQGIQAKCWHKRRYGQTLLATVQACLHAASRIHLRITVTTTTHTLPTRLHITKV